VVQLPPRARRAARPDCAPANKCDRQSELEPGQDLTKLEEWAEEHETPIFRTSIYESQANEGEKRGVDQLFECIADLLDRRTRDRQPPPPPPDFSWVPGSTVRFPFDSAIIGPFRVHHITAIGAFCTYTVEELRLLDYHIYRRIVIPQLEREPERQVATSAGWRIPAHRQEDAGTIPEPVPWYAIPAENWPEFSDEENNQAK
jgi:hypothetical protein